MKLFSPLLDRFRYNQPLVNAYKKHGEGKSNVMYGEGSAKAVRIKKGGLPKDYVVKHAWVINTREEAKRYYPKLIASQDAALKEIKYGATSEALKRRQLQLAAIYAINLSTAAFGIFRIFTSTGGD